MFDFCEFVYFVGVVSFLELIEVGFGWGLGIFNLGGVVCVVVRMLFDCCEVVWVLVGVCLVLLSISLCLDFLWLVLYLVYLNIFV